MNGTMMAQSLAWRSLVDEGLPAATQMARDVRLAGEAVPTLRLFTWQPPALSWGLKQLPPAWWNRDAARALGVDDVERPTGGGMAIHGSDVSVSVVLPRSLRLPLVVVMRTVCQSVSRLCQSFGVDAQTVLDLPASRPTTYCLAEASSYAVLVGGRKVAGFALRRYPESWLIQGSLLVRPMPQPIQQLLPKTVALEYHRRAVALAEAAGDRVDEQRVITLWRSRWPRWWDEVVVAGVAERSHAV